MNRFTKTAAGLVVAAVVIVACRDDRILAPTSRHPNAAQQDVVTPRSCTTLASLQSEIRTVFSNKGPDANSALGKLDNVDKQLQAGHIDQAQSLANDLISFIFLKAKQGRSGQGGSTTSSSQIRRAFSNNFCRAMSRC